MPLLPRIGLTANGSPRPLKGMNVHVIVEQYISQVEVVTRFINTEDSPIEAIFHFQQEDTSIYEFKVEIGDKVLVSYCKEKEQAANIYDDAIAGGHGAYMLSKDKDEKYSLSVGSVPPNAECIISIKYVTTLNTLGDALKLTIPLTKVQISNDKPSERFPSDIFVTGTINMASAIIGLESEHHAIECDIKANSATLKTKGNTPSNEFVLTIGLDEARKEPSAVVEIYEPVTGSKNQERATTVMVSFYPGIDSIFQEEGAEILMEYVFLVDRSGSMSGSKNDQLKNALQLFLRSIPVGSVFNIVGFGSNYELLFPTSVEYNDDTLATATSHAAELKANLGGTEILEPLAYILKQPPHGQFPRQVIILTDGQVSNEEKVITLAKKNTEYTRIFTLGIGSDVSTHLVEGIAKAGKGFAEFVQTNERMEVKVLSQLKRAMQPYLNAKIDWNSLKSNIKQSPTTIPPIFAGAPVVVYGLLNRDLTPSDDHVTLTLSTVSGRSVNKKVSLSSARVSRGSMCGVLAASAAIQEFEKKIESRAISEAEAKTVVLPLALKYSLVTRFTSLIAKELRAEPVEGTMQIREISSQIKETNMKNVYYGRQSEGNRFILGEDDDFSGSAIQNKDINTLRNVQRMVQQTESIGASVLQDLQAQREQISRIDANLENTSSSLGSNISRSLSSVKDRIVNFFTPWNSSPIGGASSNPLYQDSSRAGENPMFSDGGGGGYTSGYVSTSFFGNASSASSSLKEEKKMSVPTVSSTSKAEAPKDSPSVRPLDKLIVLQKASGNWTISPALLELAKVTEIQLETAFQEEKKKGEWVNSVIATALALALLELRFADSSAEWSLLGEKATKWLTKELLKNNATEKPNDFIIKAKGLISSV